MKTHTTRTIRSARGYPHERHGFHRYWVQANKLYIVHIDFQFERKKNNTRIDFNEKYDCPNCSVLICLVSIHLNRWLFSVSNLFFWIWFLLHHWLLHNRHFSLLLLFSYFNIENASDSFLFCFLWKFLHQHC